MVRLPDITRISRSKGVVDGDFGISGAFNHVLPGIRAKLKARYYNTNEDVLENFFLRFYSLSDAVYRRDFLSELLDDAASRMQFDDVNAAIPARIIRGAGK